MTDIMKECCATCEHYPCDSCEDDPDNIDLTRSVCACWDQNHMKNHMKININLTEKEQVLQTIRDNPGISTGQIKTPLPDIDPEMVEKYLVRLSGCSIYMDLSEKKYYNRWRII